LNIYNGVLNFKGTWRTYQKRVLDNSAKYLMDKKVHIVAAPGSGKTTLGIELIRRQGAPCLVLSPSITIREQWIGRIRDGFFVEGNDPEAWLSNNIKKAKPITAITYQALHSCMKQYVGVLEEIEDENIDSEERVAEEVDFAGFDIYEVVKNMGIKTICLDEAHHLRSEWWKALEEFLKNIPDVTVIALTATPPYDSDPGMWKRYIDLCGPIDEEIFTPELVKEGSLCPHQDYIYFNWPTAEEKKAIEEYSVYATQMIVTLVKEQQFVNVIASHVALANPMEYIEKLLDNPAHFMAMLAFLNEAGVELNPYLLQLTGKKGKLPELTDYSMEILLQNLLYEDTGSYTITQAYKLELINRLKEGGCIYRNKVRFAKTDEVKKLLMSSKGKINSINDIVKAEYANMGDKLRMLVLCDYIKKEYLAAVDVPDKSVNELGAIPIFENIRRQNIPGIRIGVLTGSIVIVPEDVEPELEELLVKNDCQGKMTPLGGTGYCKVDVKGSGNHIVSVITELFTRGKMNVLVGTKSLLGEGWDSPCINSLILATYVGSFMLSNQMRGRAIRVFKDEPNKISNIWHLACVFPKKLFSEDEQNLDGDYETLVRRFEAFLGVSFKENIIENGIDRMGIKMPTKESHVDSVNETMLQKAADREGLKRAWSQSLKVVNQKMKVEDVQEIDKKAATPGYIFYNSVAVFTGYFFLAIFCKAILKIDGFIGTLIMVFSIVMMLKYGFSIFSRLTPQRRMHKMAKALVQALEANNKLEQPNRCRAYVVEQGYVLGTYLKGGTTRDQTLYVKCLEELLGVIDNPRYLLIRSKGLFKKSDCYAVPEIFAKNKAEAESFAKYMSKALGPYEAVYTRSVEGRKQLLKARTKSFVNHNGRLQKKVKKMY